MRDLYPYLQERARLGTQGLSLGVGLSIALHIGVVAAILFTPTAAPAPEAAKVTWVMLPAAGVEGVAGGQGPLEEGKSGERQRRVEEVAPKRTEPTGYNATPNTFGLKATKPLQGTSTNPDSAGKAPVASKGRNAAANPAQGAAGTGGGGGIGTGTGIPGLKASGGIAGGTGLVDATDGDFPAWYIQQLQNRIYNNWQRLNSRPGRTQIYFRVRKDGGLYNIRVEIGSGNNELDQSALMAVRRSDPMPPLPPGYPADSLGVWYWFTSQAN